MSEYLLKWKDEFRCMAIYDLATGEYPRLKGLKEGQEKSDSKLDGTDIYIPCHGKDMIYDYDSSNSTLIAHFDVKARGKILIAKIYDDLYHDLSKFENEVLKKKKDGTKVLIKEIDGDKLFDHINSLNLPLMNSIETNQCELWFKFNGNKHIHQIAKFMKAKKPMAAKTPYSSKYLPSHKVKLAEKFAERQKEDYIDYKPEKGYYKGMPELITNIGKIKNIKIADIHVYCQREFSNSIGVDLIKDAEDNKYKINHYIHHLGLWNQYKEFLQTLTNV